jgi:hypothetical protein
MNRVFHSLGIAAGAVVLAFSLSAVAQTDNFMSECQQGSSAADPAKACTCMSDKVTGAVRADAIAAMHSMNTIKGTNGGGPDPKTLPANQQKGLEAIVAAHGQCR